MTNKELESKVEALEKSIEDMQGAIRRMATEVNTLFNVSGKHSEKDQDTLSKLARLQLELDSVRNVLSTLTVNSSGKYQ